MNALFKHSIVPAQNLFTTVSYSFFLSLLSSDSLNALQLESKSSGIQIKKLDREYKHLFQSSFFLQYTRESLQAPRKSLSDDSMASHSTLPLMKIFMYGVFLQCDLFDMHYKRLTTRRFVSKYLQNLIEGGSINKIIQNPKISNVNKVHHT